MRKQKKWVIRESGPHWKDADKDCGLQVEKKMSRKKNLIDIGSEIIEGEDVVEAFWKEKPIHEIKPVLKHKCDL